MSIGEKEELYVGCKPHGVSGALYTEPPQPGLIPVSHLKDRIFCNRLSLMQKSVGDLKIIIDERLKAALNKIKMIFV